jgi:hypothetical protein
MGQMSEGEDLAAFNAAAQHYCTVLEGVKGRYRADVLFDLGEARARTRRARV